MLVTHMNTEFVAASERFEFFTDVTAHSHMPNRLSSNNQENFLAEMRVLDLGEVQVSALSFPHLTISRTAKLIRQSDPEVYQLNCFLGAEGVLSQADGDTALRLGDLVLMDSNHPYRGDVHAAPGRWTHMTVQLPRELLPFPEKTVHSLLGTPIDGHRAMGGALTRWLTDLTTRADEFTPTDTSALASVTLDLLAAVIARRLEAEKVLSPEARKRALWVQIDAFVKQRLADPALTPHIVATAHAISPRYLYTLFHDQGTTVAARIRELRLERCRRDLADPCQRYRPVQAIASRWAFSDPAHFSRIFRAAYGMTPKDYRHYAQHPTLQKSASAVHG